MSHFTQTHLRYEWRPLCIDSISPNHGPIGTLVEVTGTYFLEVTGVSLGFLPVDSLNILDNERLTFIVSNALSVGPASLAISRGGGPGNTIHGSFTVDP